MGNEPSWYSSADTHIFLNVLRPARMLPPIQVEYLRSGGALIRILVSRRASFLTSCSSRSPKPVLHPTMYLPSALYSLDQPEGEKERTLDESPSTAEDDVAKEALAEVEVGAVDRVDDDLVDARVLEADEFRGEEKLGGSVSFWPKL